MHRATCIIRMHACSHMRHLLLLVLPRVRQGLYCAGGMVDVDFERQAHLPHLLAVGIIGCGLPPAVQEDSQAMSLLVKPQRSRHRQESWWRNLQQQLPIYLNVYTAVAVKEPGSSRGHISGSLAHPLRGV